MNQFVVIVGEESEKTELFFQNKIPSSDDHNNERFYFMKQYSNYKGIYVLLAKSFEQQQNYFSKEYFNQISRQIGKNDRIAFYLYYPHKPFQQKNYFFENGTKGKLILLYDDYSELYAEQYKEAYNISQTFHINNFQEMIKTLFPKCIRDFQECEFEMSLLLGKSGVGKTTLFKKATRQIIYDNKDFEQFIFQQEQFQLIDCPSFDLETKNISKRESEIKTFQNFFSRHKTKISTIFYLISFERFDIMKQDFILLYRYFKKFSKNIVILVTKWDLVENDEAQLKEQFKNFLSQTLIKDVVFLRGDINEIQLKLELKAFLKSQQGIDLSNTIFDDTIGEEELKYNETLQNKIQQIKEKKQEPEKKRDEILREQVVILKEENLDLEKQIFEFQQRINKNRSQIFDYESQIRKIEWEDREQQYKNLSYKSNCQQSKQVQENNLSKKVKNTDYNQEYKTETTKFNQQKQDNFVTSPVINQLPLNSCQNQKNNLVHDASQFQEGQKLCQEKNTNPQVPQNISQQNINHENYTETFNSKNLSQNSYSSNKNQSNQGAKNRRY